MNRAVWRAMPVLAVAAGIMLVTGGPAGAASRAGSSSPGAAQATAPALKVQNYRLPGREFAVSCMTVSRCVAIGAGRGRGTVLTVNNGRPGRLITVRGSRRMSAISCPPSTYIPHVPLVPVGCWVVGTSLGGRVLLVKLSAAGKVIGLFRPPAQSDALAAISCLTITSCEVAGVQAGTPGGIELGTWNGTSLTLIPVAGPAATTTVITALSCYHSRFFCAAVGYADTSTGVTGLILKTQQGTPWPLTLTSNYAYEGVSCSGRDECATDGNSTGGSGVKLFGVACFSPTCAEAGKVRSARSRRFVGVLIINYSKVQTSRVRAVAGFTGIARRGPGNGFAAIGPGPRSGSVLTVGAARNGFG